MLVLTCPEGRRELSIVMTYVWFSGANSEIPSEVPLRSWLVTANPSIPASEAVNQRLPSPSKRI